MSVFGNEEREQDGGNVERLRSDIPLTLTLHHETLISNLEHGLAFARTHIVKCEHDLAVLKSTLGR